MILYYMIYLLLYSNPVPRQRNVKMSDGDFSGVFSGGRGDPHAGQPAY